MKTFFDIILWIIFFVGSYGILWPLPAFLLNEENAKIYLNFIWNLPAEDKSAGAALPFFWMFFTAPLGLAIICVSFGLDALLNWLFKK